jgi:hypothetical protein
MSVFVRIHFALAELTTVSASHSEVGKERSLSWLAPVLPLDFSPSPWLTTANGTEAKIGKTPPGTTTLGMGTTTHGMTTRLATTRVETMTIMERERGENSIMG